MRLFLYYAIHSTINTLKKLLKTWLAFVVAISLFAGIVGMLIGRVVPLIIDSVKGEQITSEITSELPSEVVEEDEDGGLKLKISVSLEKYGLTKMDVFDIMVTVCFFFMVTVCLATVNKGGQIFKPADVPLLFASPMKPQSVLMFRLMNSLISTFLIAFYMFFQVPNIVTKMNVSVWAGFLVIFAYFMTLVLSTLLQVGFYAVACNTENQKINISGILLGFYGALAASFIAYTMITKQEIVPALFGFFGSKNTFWIPFWGWIRGMIYYAFLGETLKSVIFAVLFVVACVIIILVIWNMKVDFYENAMTATEKVALQVENAQNAQKGIAVTREKARSAKLERDGFHYGSGANVFFFKALYNRFRFATFKIFSKTFLAYLIAAIAVGYIARTLTLPFDAFLLPAAAFALITFYRTLGNPLEEDTSREFFILIPSAPLKKIWCSLLGVLAVCAVDLIIPLIIAAILTGTNPFAALGWFIYILAISLFGTAVGAFINLSIPGESAQTIKAAVQMMFIYFGVFPSLGFVAAGIILKMVFPMLLVGAVFNAVIGAVFTFITPYFLSSK